MHAQRCPMAKLLAASHQNKGMPGPGTSYPRQPNSARHQKEGGQGLKNLLSSKAKTRISNQAQRNRNPEKHSFFQELHGDAAPLLPPCPQMYSDDSWSQHFDAEKTSSMYTKNKREQKAICERPQIFNEKCAIHGFEGRRGSRHFVFPKSISCPTPSRIESRQTANAERLKNWRRNSLTISGSNGRAVGVGVPDHQNVAPHQLSCRHFNRQPLGASPLNPLPSTTPSMFSISKNAITDDLQIRRSQFRKALSFFSIGCDDLPKEKQPPSQRILRQPTRHVYRRGISGLPIECTNRSMGVAF